MTEQIKDLSVSDRFNAFHLEVAVLSERIGWVLNQMMIEDQGTPIFILHSMQCDLERLLDAQDCREDLPVSGEAKLNLVD